MKIFKIIFLLAISNNLLGQNLKEHTWKDRLILIFAEHKSSELLKMQLLEFDNREKELKERRIFRYVILPDQYMSINDQLDNSFADWNEHRGEVYNIFMDQKDEFKLMLVGLDGSTKLESHNEVVAIREILI